jgi:hypothetical protein
LIACMWYLASPYVVYQICRGSLTPQRAAVTEFLEYQRLTCIPLDYRTFVIESYSSQRGMSMKIMYRSSGLPYFDLTLYCDAPEMGNATHSDVAF